MIPLAEINAAAERGKVPAETIEKDYVICWILKSLSTSTLKNDFIFYGGTAIKRIYFEDHRFSEDIDLLTSKLLKPEDLAEELKRTLQTAKEQTNLAMMVDSGRILSSGTRTQIFVQYFGYDEIMGAPKEIRLDFSMDMDLYGESTEGKIFESYSDLRKKNGNFPVQTLNTILAGKLGLLTDSTRKEPRDLFDIWFILSRLDQFDFDLGKVCQFFKQKYGYEPSLGVLRPHLGNRIYNDRWETRLRKQIADLPAIEKVTRETERKLEELFG